MKKLLIPALLVANSFFGQLTYVDNFDGVYPYSAASTFNFDINGDGQNDLRLWRYSSTSNATCNGATSLAKYGNFRGLTNTYGLNLLNGNGLSSIGIFPQTSFNEFRKENMYFLAHLNIRQQMFEFRCYGFYEVCRRIKLKVTSEEVREFFKIEEGTKKGTKI